MRLARSGHVLVALALAVLVALVPTSPALPGQLRSDDFPTAVLAIGSLVLLTVSGWVVVVAAAGSLGPSSRVVRAVAPRCVRHALFVGVAGAMVVSPAHAERSSPGDHSVRGLPLPDRPTSARTSPDTTADAAPPRVFAPRAHRVVVQPGDTLWAIAARSLPAGATTAEIAAACDRWHAANRAAIGDDPDLIFPHQRLTPPGKDQP